MSFATMHNDYLDPDRHLWPDEEPEDAEVDQKWILLAYDGEGGTTAYGLFSSWEEAEAYTKQLYARDWEVLQCFYPAQRKEAL